jgi:hypothetical protein
VTGEVDAEPVGSVLIEAWQPDNAVVTYPAVPDVEVTPMLRLAQFLAEASPGKRTGTVLLNTDLGEEMYAQADFLRLLSEGKPVLVGTKASEIKGAKDLDHGLLATHQYEVIGMHDGFVQLHNPWGRHQPPVMRLRDFLDNAGSDIATLKD